MGILYLFGQAGADILGVLQMALAFEQLRGPQRAWPAVPSKA